MSTHHSVTRILAPRRLMAAAALVAVAALGTALASPTDAALADTRSSSHSDSSSHAVSTKLTAAYENGTLVQDIRSGKLTDADLSTAMTSGLDVAGKHVTLAAPTPAEAAEGKRIAAQMKASGTGAAEGMAQLSGAGTSAAATGSGAVDVKPGAGDPLIEPSAHWWSNHWVYINGTWLKVLIAATIGVVASAICAFLSISGPWCIPIAALVSGSVEFLKNTQCARRGVWIDFPYLWKTHC